MAVLLLVVTISMVSAASVGSGNTISIKDQNRLGILFNANTSRKLPTIPLYRLN